MRGFCSTSKRVSYVDRIINVLSYTEIGQLCWNMIALNCFIVQLYRFNTCISFRAENAYFFFPFGKGLFSFFFFFPPPSNNPVKEVTIEMTLSPKECYSAWQYDSWDFGKISSTCFMLFMSIVDFLLSLLQLLRCTGMSLIIIIKFVICWREEKRRKCLFFFSFVKG